MKKWAMLAVAAGAAGAVLFLPGLASASEGPKPEDDDEDEDDGGDPDDGGSAERVYVKNYGIIPAGDPRLAVVPAIYTKGGAKRLHKAVLPSLVAMFVQAEKDGIDRLRVASGWRARQWKTYEEYTKAMIAQYGSLAKGKKFRAWDSPHMTGLAGDFNNDDLSTSSKKVASMRKSATHAWLVANAAKYGWKPYKAEPWHWEHPIALSEWR